MKCFYCKNIIDLTKIYDGSYVLNKNHYCHCACFIQYKTSLKKGTWTKEQSIKYLQPLKKKTENIVKKTYYLNRLFDWYCQFYGKRIIPVKSKQLINSIVNGQYKDVNIKIPTEDLFEMLAQNQEKLKQINYQLEIKNLHMGKDVTTEAMFAYDIAVVINDYDNYLEQKQLILQENALKKKRLSANRNGQIDYTVFKKYHRSENKGADIYSVIDDI